MRLLQTKNTSPCAFVYQLFLIYNRYQSYLTRQGTDFYTVWWHQSLCSTLHPCLASQPALSFLCNSCHQSQFMPDLRNLKLPGIWKCWKNGDVWSTNGCGGVELCVVGNSMMCLVSIIQFSVSQWDISMPVTSFSSSSDSPGLCFHEGMIEGVISEHSSMRV